MNLLLGARQGVHQEDDEGTHDYLEVCLLVLQPLQHSIRRSYFQAYAGVIEMFATSGHAFEGHIAACKHPIRRAIHSVLQRLVRGPCARYRVSRKSTVTSSSC